MASGNPQRAYRAPCPGCGAPVDFASAQSTHAVCGYCQSLVVRDGEALSRIGKMAELFDDHSPLQLQTSGVFQGQAFTLVGRLQYKYPEGTWTEWYAMLQDGSSAFLAEDNGAYVFSKPIPSQRDIPDAEYFRVGVNIPFNGLPFTVTSNQTVSVMTAQGELPRLPPLGQTFAMVELRGQADASVLSVDYGSHPPTLCMGSSVLLEQLKLSGLREENEKTNKGRQFNCPNCGAALTLQLAGSKSMTCSSCHSIIDVSQGIGGELKHALQDEPINPLIPLGTIGSIQGAQWQVVGFQHRMGVDPNDSDEQFGWEEYLLYNQKRGFTFLVDSTEGWSLVQPTTGAPVVSSNGQAANYLGTRYALKDSYRAETSYVVGEFYWQVQRGQPTQNRDYVSGNGLLSMEQSAKELTWSVGSKVASADVAKAFKLEAKAPLLQRSDASPVSSSSTSGMAVIVLVVIALILFVTFSTRCSSCDSAYENCANGSGYRTSGGSYGGYSGGGGHK